MATIDLADKTTLDLVAGEMGSHSDLASNTPATLFAGLKYLLANGGSVIRTVQRGIATITAPDIDIVVNLDDFVFRTNKSLVLIDGTDTSGASPYLFNISGGTLAFRKPDTNLDCTFSWQVIEFY